MHRRLRGIGTPPAKGAFLMVKPYVKIDVQRKLMTLLRSIWGALLLQVKENICYFKNIRWFD